MARMLSTMTRRMYLAMPSGPQFSGAYRDTEAQTQL